MNTPHQWTIYRTFNNYEKHLIKESFEHFLDFRLLASDDEIQEFIEGAVNQVLADLHKQKQKEIVCSQPTGLEGKQAFEEYYFKLTGERYRGGR